MKYVHLYLIGYITLVIGGVLALWRWGVLSRLGPVWIVIGLIVAVGIGIMMSVASGKPDLTRE